MSRRPVHLQGMGMLGSYLAQELENHKIPFTWSDNYQQITSWVASTGAIYPSGHRLDMAAYEEWRKKDVEAAHYWYTTKNAPHEGKWSAVRDVGPLRQHPLPSLHLHVQNFVQDARERYAEYAALTPPEGARVVIAHGFNSRLTHYVWGWSRQVRLRYPQEWGRSSFYCRKGRFVMAYAYPIQGTQLWWAGSSLIVQKQPKVLEVEGKYARWQRNFTELTGGLVEVEPVGTIYQGWRPASTDTGLVKTINGQLVVLPLWHSGVRWAPAVASAVLVELSK